MSNWKDDLKRHIEEVEAILAEFLPHDMTMQLADSFQRLDTALASVEQCIDRTVELIIQLSVHRP